MTLHERRRGVWGRPQACRSALSTLDRITLLAAAAAGAGMLAGGALVPTERWAAFFAHPLRVERLGTIPRTTLDGATAWRVALVAGGIAIPLLAAALAGASRRAAAIVGPGSSNTSSAPAPDRTASARRSPFDGIGLVGLLVFATIVRAPRLIESLWYDEIAAYLAFSQHGPGPTMGNYFTQSNHVLQGMLAWASAAVAGGADELSLRVPTLVASLLTIPAMAALGREAVGGAGSDAATTSAGVMERTLPWLLAWTAAIGPLFVLEAVEARGYAFMILAAALSTTLFLRGLRRPTTATWTLYALVVALGAWSHLVTICVALGHGSVVAWVVAVGLRRPDAGVQAIRAASARSRTAARRSNGMTCTPGGGRADPFARGRLSRWTDAIRSPLSRACARGSDGCAVEPRAILAALVALVLSAIVTVVLYAPALPDMLAIRREFRALDGNEPTLIGPEGLHALLSFGGAWFWWSALPAGVLALVGAFACVGEACLRRAAMAALAGLPVAVALAWIGDSWLYARFLLFALPGAALLVGVGAAWTLARSRLAGIAAVVAVGGCWIADLAVRPPKQPLRDAVAEVAAARGPGPAAADEVATIGLADNVLAWYGVLRGMDIASTGPLGRDLAGVLDRRHPRFVIVLYEHNVPRDRFELLAQRGYSLRTRHRGWVDWTNGDVLVFERR